MKMKDRHLKLAELHTALAAGKELLITTDNEVYTTKVAPTVGDGDLEMYEVAPTEMYYVDFINMEVKSMNVDTVKYDPFGIDAQLVDDLQSVKNWFQTKESAEYCLKHVMSVLDTHSLT